MKGPAAAGCYGKVPVIINGRKYWKDVSEAVKRRHPDFYTSAYKGKYGSIWTLDKVAPTNERTK
jgi:hypothetical protein